MSLKHADEFSIRDKENRKHPKTLRHGHVVKNSEFLTLF